MSKTFKKVIVEPLKLAAKKAKAKKDAEIKNRHGVAVRSLDVPEGQYTHEITCTSCGALRKVKPQDVHQVKLCLACRDAQKKDSMKAFIARQNDPERKRQEKLKKAFARIDAWAELTTIEVDAGFAAMKRFNERWAKEPKPRRIWP